MQLHEIRPGKLRAVRHLLPWGCMLAAPLIAFGQDDDQGGEGEGQQRSGAIADELQHVDPTLDGWQTEVLQGKAKDMVYEFLQRTYASGQRTQEAFSDLISEGFEGATSLRPKGMQPIELAGGTLVFRPELWDPDLEPASSLAGQIEDLCGALGSAGGLRFAVKMVQCRELEDELFEAEAWIQVDGRSEEGAVQQNFAWHMRFELGEEDRAMLRSIELRDFSEVHTSGPYFTELTEFVLGDLPFFERELSLGVDDYHYKVDRLTGNSFLGSQGLALGDVNGDGLDDLYLSQQGGMPNRLLLRNADGTLRDFTKESGTGLLDNTRSSLILDMDGDGDQDLVLAIGPNVILLYNDGELHFDEHVFLGNDVPTDIFSLSAADPDGDGDLDIYACRYIDNGIMGGNPTPYHDANNGSPNLYWRNEGDRKFKDATEEVGLGVNNAKFSLASIWEDFDSDGDLDLYVANDFGRNTLYRNDGERFAEVGVSSGAGETAASMGLSCSDIDLDGDMDVLVSNMFSAAGRRVVPNQEKFMGGAHPTVHQFFERHARGNTLLVNRGDGSFEDTTEVAGIELGRWAWGGRFVDFNGDGYEDMYVPNGFVTGPDEDDL